MKTLLSRALFDTNLRSISRTGLVAPFAWLLMFAAGFVHAQSRVVVTDMKLAMRSALEAPVAGLFAGEVAAYAAREFKSSEPVLVDIKRIGNHQQPGCGRLRVQLSQNAARMPDATGTFGQPAPQALAYSLNFCEDGTFPRGEEGK
jgi:hypothetical protein